MTDTQERTDRGPVEQESGGPSRQALFVGLGILALILFGLGWPWLVVIVSLILMVFLHELGHYVVAKAAGMKVTEFFIGFGPRLWSFKRGETEYGFKAIPAGAYVRIIGMTNLEEIDPADADRTYRSKPFWRKISVAVAGPAANLLVAVVLLFVLFVGWGERDASQWQIEEVQVSSAAAEIGFESGDRVLAVNGQEIDTFTDMADIVSASPGEEATFVVLRDGDEIQLQGAIGERNGQGLLGVSHDPSDLPTVRENPGSAAVRSFTDFGSIVKLTVTAVPDGVANLFDGIFDTEEPAAVSGGAAPSSVQGTGSSEDDGRLLSIYGAARLGTQLTEQGVPQLLAFLVLINIFLGIFNLIPLLPLDGGHVVVATYEKLRSRPGKPYQLDAAKLLPVTYAVLALLVLVGVSALWLDISDPVNLPS